MSKKALKKLQKILNFFVVLMLLVQPVGAPSMMVAYAAEGDTITPVEAQKEEVKAEEVKTEKVETPVAKEVEEPKITISEKVETPIVSETTTLAEQPADGAITSEATSTEKNVEKTVEVQATQPMEIWAKDGNKQTTINAVEKDVVYTAPQNDQVTVKFSKLPEIAGKLSIEEITLTSEQVAQLHALSNKAYDITSDMADGTFEYELSLPKPADQKKVEVKFAENLGELSKNAETLAGDDMDVKNTQVNATLNHFTIFTVVAAWNFPNDPDNAKADGGVAMNADKVITVQGGSDITGFAMAGATTNSARANKWNGGAGVKFWRVIFDSTGFENLKISSKQRSSADGPRDFKMQYKIGTGGDWTDFGPAVIAVANNYSSGVVTSVSLPKEANNQSDVRVRWIMTSDIAVSGGAIDPTGASNIDDILVEGIDATNPVVTDVEMVAEDTTPWHDYAPYFKGDVTNRLRAKVSDLGSGLNTASCKYTLDGGVSWSAGYFNASNQRCYFDIDPVISNRTVYNVNIQVADSVGNIGIGTAREYISDAYPAVAFNVNFTPGNGTYTTANTTISGNITDAASPIIACYYRYAVNGNGYGGWIPGTWTQSTHIIDENYNGICTADINGLTEGIYSFEMKGVDSAGHDVPEPNHLEAFGKKTITIDATAPTVDLVFPTAGNPSSNYFQAVFSEDVNPSDATNPANYFLNNWPDAGGSGDLTGDATIAYDSSFKTATITFTNPGWYISAEQQWGVQNIHDLAGNLQTDPYTEYSTPLLAPVTTATPSGTMGLNSYYVSDVTVNLNATDGDTSVGSGIRATHYLLDEAGMTDGTSILVNTDGNHTINYYSEDNAGNVEAEQSISFKIDKTKPESTINLPTNSGSGSSIEINSWTGAISGTATDNSGSGVAGVKISIKNGAGEYWDGTTFVASATELLNDATHSEGAWQYAELNSPADDTYTITSHAVDNAGNQENSYKLTIISDKTIPEINLTMNPLNPNGDNNWYITQPQATLTANDNFHVANIQYQLNTTVGEWLPYINPIVFSDGAWVLYYRSIDNASNVSAVGVKNIKVDTRNPDEVNNFQATYNGVDNQVRLTWNANDNDINRVYIYQGKSKTFTMNNNSLLAKQNKSDETYTDKNITVGEKYFYKIFTRDEAGNTSNTKIISITIPAGGLPAVSMNAGTAPTPAGTVPNDNGTVAGQSTENPQINTENPQGGSGDNQGGKVLGEETSNNGGFWGNNWKWIVVVFIIGSGIFWFVRRKPNGTLN